jgi:hypothetical protein
MKSSLPLAAVVETPAVGYFNEYLSQRTLYTMEVRLTKTTL